MRLAAIPFAALMLIVTVQAQSEDDQKRILGKWKVVQAEVNGATVPADKIQYARYTFERDKLITGDGGKREEKNYKLITTANPKALDITFPSPVNKGKTETWPGIYRFTRDGLVICFSNTSKTRPAEFRTRANSGQIMMMLARDE
jgi:uncharacterized protein (TIGR03067 family)